jgi:hypothetical protein
MTARDRDESLLRMSHRWQIITTVLAIAVLSAAGCGGSRGRDKTPQASQSSQVVARARATPLDGVYRNTIMVSEYVSAGVDPGWAIANAGMHTVTLRDGRARDEVRGVQVPVCRATYSVRGRTIRFGFDQAVGCTGYFTAIWSLRGAELRFTSVRADDAGGRSEWALKPFRKIG